jgi:hypothetical protein
MSHSMGIQVGWPEASTMTRTTKNTWLLISCFSDVLKILHDYTGLRGGKTVCFPLPSVFWITFSPALYSGVSLLATARVFLFCWWSLPLAISYTSSLDLDPTTCTEPIHCLEVFGKGHEQLDVPIWRMST